MNLEDFRISVIITSYNQKNYLIQTIESVINQTVSPYEIIIADDHSKDGSVELIQKYMSQYPDLVKGVFQTQNVGIPKNRNSACEQVTGNYVAILDGDDLFSPFKLEKEFQALEKNPKARCVYSNIRFIDSEGKLIGIRDREPRPSGDIFTYIAHGRGGLLRSMLMDYSLMQEIGFLNENFPKYDGLELTVRLSKRCEFIYIAEPLADKREHEASDSRTLKAKDHLHDLERIYQNVLTLSNDLPLSEKVSIQVAWFRRLTNLRIRNFQEQGLKMLLPL